MINTNDPYMAYYRNQVGGSVSTVFRGGGVSSVFRGGNAAVYQRGHGIGSFLGGLFRSVMPILKSGASAVGKEALRSGVGFLGDVVTKGDARQAANTRLREFTGGLKRRADNKLDRVLQGHGSSVAYKKRRVTRVTPQSLANLLRVRMSPTTSTTIKKRKSTVTKRKQQQQQKGGRSKRITSVKRKVKRGGRRISNASSKKRRVSRKQQHKGGRKNKCARRDIFA